MASLKYYRIRANSGSEDYFKGQVPRLRLHVSWILLIVLRLFSFFQGVFKLWCHWKINLQQVLTITYNSRTIPKIMWSKFGHFVTSHTYDCCVVPQYIFLPCLVCLCFNSPRPPLHLSPWMESELCRTKHQCGQPSTSVDSSSITSAAYKQWWVQPGRRHLVEFSTVTAQEGGLDGTHTYVTPSLLPIYSTTDFCLSHFLTYLISITVHLSKSLWVASFSINLVKTLITSSSILSLLDLL